MFGKPTPGLALVQLLVGGDGGGGRLFVQRQHTLYQCDHFVVAGDVGGVVEVDDADEETINRLTMFAKSA